MNPVGSIPYSLPVPMNGAAPTAPATRPAPIARIDSAFYALQVAAVVSFVLSLGAWLIRTAAEAVRAQDAGRRLDPSLFRQILLTTWSRHILACICAFTSCVGYLAAFQGGGLLAAGLLVGGALGFSVCLLITYLQLRQNFQFLWNHANNRNERRNPNPVPARPQIPDAPISSFETFLEAIGRPVQNGRRRTPGVFTEDGGSFQGAVAVTDAAARQAVIFLREIVTARLLTNSQGQQRRNIQKALNTLAENRCKDVIGVYLVEANRIIVDMREAARRENRPLTPDEENRLTIGLTALVEGLQNCSGAWVAHMAQVLAGLSGEQISDRNWTLRLFAKERLSMVEAYFADKSQQVHYINQLSWELWNRLRIALPGAQLAREDWYVRGYNHSRAIGALQHQIEQIQTPHHLADVLRAALNLPESQMRCLSLQTELANHLSRSSTFQTPLLAVTSNLIEECRNAPLAEESPTDRLAALQNELTAAEQTIAQVLPWRGSIIHLIDSLRSSPAAERQIIAALERARLEASLPSTIAELLHAFNPNNAEQRSALLGSLERQLTRAVMTQPGLNQRVQRAQQTQRSLRELEQQLNLCRELLGNQPVLDADLSRVHATMSALSERMEAREGWPSLWHLLFEGRRLETLKPALSTWLRNPGRAQSVQLSTHLTGRIGPEIARRDVLPHFPNDQVSIEGAFQILEMFGLVERA